MEVTATTGMSPVRLSTFLSVWDRARGFKFGNWPCDYKSASWGFLLPGLRAGKAGDETGSRPSSELFNISQ